MSCRVHATGNGVFYVLDRTDGESPGCHAVCPRHLGQGLGRNRPADHHAQLALHSRGQRGSTPAWEAAAISRHPPTALLTGWMYFVYHDGGSRTPPVRRRFEPGRQFFGAAAGRGGARPPEDDTQGILAMDPENRDDPMEIQPAEESLSAGVLATAGRTFGGSREGNLIALDAEDRQGPVVFPGRRREPPRRPMSCSVDRPTVSWRFSSGALYSFALPDDSGHGAGHCLACPVKRQAAIGYGLTLGHASYSGVKRESLMAKALFACDELCGFIVACTLVRPNKQIEGLEVNSVKKKLKDKAFARNVNREDIVQGAAELGIPLEEHIQFVIGALKANAPGLGL